MTTGLNQIGFVLNHRGKKMQVSRFSIISEIIWQILKPISIQGDPTLARVTIAPAMISPITKRVRVIIGSLVRG